MLVKNIFKLFLLLVLLTPMLVFADMSAPSNATYKAIVVSDNAKYYDNNYNVKGTLKKGTIIKVRWEFKKGNEYYAEFEFDEVYGKIKISDIASYDGKFESNVNDSEVWELDEKIELYVYGTNGIQMYNGPAMGLGKIITIPQGETLYPEKSFDGWYYVTYKGKSGWIPNYAYNENEDDKEILLLTKVEEETYITNTDTYIITSDKTKKKIKANEFVSRKYYSNNWDNLYYIYYNGVDGLVNDSDITKCYKKVKRVVIPEDIKIYETIEMKKALTVVPKGTILEYYAADGDYYSYYYVSYNGIKGWISDKIPGGAFGELYEFIKLDDQDFEEEETTVTTTKKSEEKVVNNFDKKTTMLLCGGTAVIIILTATVTAVLVNKKNKKKNV